MFCVRHSKQHVHLQCHGENTFCYILHGISQWSIVIGRVCDFLHYPRILFTKEVDYVHIYKYILVIHICIYCLILSICVKSDILSKSDILFMYFIILYFRTRHRYSKPFLIRKVEIAHIGYTFLSPEALPIRCQNSQTVEPWCCELMDTNMHFRWVFFYDDILKFWGMRKIQQTVLISLHNTQKRCLQIVMGNTGDGWLPAPIT